MTDRQLIAIISENPDEGIRIAIERYGDLVYSIAVRVLGKNKKEDVEECVSAVFVRLWKYRKNFKEEKGSLQSYIITIARNEALRKTKSLHKKIWMMYYRENFENSLESKWIEKESAKNIKEMIDQLKYPDNQIIIQRYFWEYNIKDIAHNLELDEKVVTNKIYYLKKKLKKILIKRR